MSLKRYYYRDKILREIFSEMIKTRKMTSGNNGYIRFSDIDWKKLQYDARNYIGYYIILTMISCNPRLSYRQYSSEQMLKWIKRISNEIPNSIRWSKIGTLDGSYLKSNIEIREDDIEIMNVLEASTIMNIILKYWDAPDSISKSKHLNILNDYLKHLGFNDIKHYRRFQTQISYRLSPEFLSRSETLISEFHFAPIEFVENICANVGISKETICWDHDTIQELNLKEIPEMIVPLFFEKDEYVMGHPKKGYFFDEHMFKSNDISLLCFSNENIFEQLIRIPSEKGDLFNKSLFDLLIGQAVSLLDKSTMTCLYGIDIGEKILKDPRWEKAVEVRYSYKSPLKSSGYEVKIRKKSHPGLNGFLEKIGKEETDIDLILLHKKDPKHVILGECLFSNKYNHLHYLDRIKKLEKLVNYLNNNPNSLTELGFNQEYLMVPIVFGSSFGVLHKYDQPVILSSLSLAMYGYFKKQIQFFIDGKTWKYNLYDTWSN